MGTYGSKASKYTANYKRNVAKKHQELRYQEGYIRDYNKLLNMGPNKSNNFKKSLSTSTVMTSAGGRKRPASFATGFKFVSEWDFHNRSRHFTFGHRSMNQWHYATHYRPVGSYPGLLEEFKGKAIRAELTGIPNAKAAIAGIKPLDLSYIRMNARGGRGNSSKKVKEQGTVTGWDPKEQKYIRTGGTGGAVLSEATKKAQQDLSDQYGISTFNLYGGLSTTPSKGSKGEKINKEGGAWVSEQKEYTAEEIASGANKDFAIFENVWRDKIDQTEELKSAEYIDRNQESIRNTGLSLAVREQQQVLSDTYGILTFDVKGNLSTLPASGMVDWDALGLSGEKHKERREQVKKQFGDEIMNSLIPSQMKVQEAKERELEAELKVINKQMKGHETKYDARTGTFSDDGSQEYWTLYQRKQAIQANLTNINNDQKVIAAALESVDYNTMMHYLAETDVITDESRKQYVSFGDPSKASLKQELTARGYEWEQQKETTEAIAKKILALENLHKNNMGTTGQQEKYDNEVASIERLFQIDLDEKGGFDKVKSQLKEHLDVSSKEQFRLRKEKDDIASQYSASLTNEERVTAAAEQNRTAVAKKEFEELTGMKAEGTAANALQAWNTKTMNDYYDQRDPELNIWYRDGSDSMKVDFDPNSVSRGKQNEFGNYGGTLSPDSRQLHDSSSDWFAQWLNPNKNWQTQTDLTLFGDINIEGKKKLQSQANIIKKYDAWERANEFIGGSLYDYKKDLNTMYSGYYSAPTVTQEEANRARVGTSTVYGDSYVFDTSVKVGGVRSGPYERQDYVKLIAEIKKTEQTLADNLEKEKQKYAELSAEREAIQKQHSELRPQISGAVERGVAQGNISVDRELQAKLSTSSDKLWDARTKEALSKTDQMYYEKSIELTEKDRLAIEQKKKELDFEFIQSRTDSTAVSRPRQYSSPGRPSLKQHSDSRMQQLEATRRARRMQSA